MKRFIRTAMAVMLAVMAVACSNDEEQPLSECRGTVRVSIDGIINGYTTQDATRAVAQNVVRIMWQGGETIYVYEGTECLGPLTATKGDDTGTYATLSGTINAPADGNHYLTLVYSPQFGETAPEATGGKLSLDLSTQDGKEVPFLIYATMPATEAPEISGASVHFDLATSVYKCNVTGLVAEGSITKAVIGEVNTVCELTLSDDAAPTVSGTTPGNISRTAGFSAADQRAIFSVAVAETGETAAGRTIEITKGNKKFSAAFDKGSLGTAAAYNTVLVLKEKQAPEGSTGAATATIGGSDVDVNWVQLWEGGPKFAEYNVGATSATDYGGYYTWGGTYKNGNGIAWSDDHNTGSVALFGTDDTATKLWGENWRMPTKVELENLLSNCTVVWTTVGGKNGRKFTGKGAYASNSVFLPAAGYCNSYGASYQDYSGHYWSSTPFIGGGYDLRFGSGYQIVDYDDYDTGHSVRAVVKELPPSTGTAKATIGGSQVDVNWVQLWEGGPKFAEYNVGVTDGKAESYGGYYTWGGTYNNDPDLPGFSWNDDHNLLHTTDNDNLTSTEDTATKLWGENWRMPTKAELEALINSTNCTVEWTTVGGVNGRKFTGKTEPYSSNSVFLPAAGNCYRNEDDEINHTSGSSAYYWSSTANGSSGAYGLFFFPNHQIVEYGNRSHGYSVRAVLAE